MRQVALFLIMLLCGSSPSLQAQSKQYMDSLENRLKDTKEPYERAKLMNKLAVTYMHTDIEKAIQYGKQSLHTLPSKYRKERAHIYNTIGNLYAYKDFRKDAILYLDSALTIHKKMNNLEGVAMVYGNMGTIYGKDYDYKKALEYQYRSLKINEEQANSTGIAHNLTAICAINFAQKDFSEALANSKKAFLLHRKIDIEGKGVSLMNVALAFGGLGQLDSSLVYNLKALALFEAGNLYENSAAVYQEISEIYSKRQEYDLAIEYINKAIALEEHFVSSEIKIRVFESLGNLYLEAKAYKKGIGVLTKSVKAAQDSGLKLYERNIRRQLANAYMHLNDYQNAHKELSAVIALNDSILDESKQKQIKELEIKYDTYRKAQENLLLAKERDIATLDARRNEQFTYSLLVVLALVLIIFYLVFRQYRSKAQAQTLQLKHRLLRNQMNPHFIFNALTAIQSFIYKSEPKEAGKFLSSFAKLVRAILENSREEYISLEKEIQWLENYLKLQLLRFDNNFSYTIEIDPGLDISDTFIPPMLTQPFIENALEHGFKQLNYKGELLVRFQVKENVLMVSVQDNGLGLAHNKQDGQDKNHVSLATVITKERITYLNKKSLRKIHFELSSVSPSGTLVAFDLPLREGV